MEFQYSLRPQQRYFASPDSASEDTEGGQAQHSRAQMALSHHIWISPETLIPQLERPGDQGSSTVAISWCYGWMGTVREKRYKQKERGCPAGWILDSGLQYRRGSKQQRNGAELEKSVVFQMTEWAMVLASCIRMNINVCAYGYRVYPSAFLSYSWKYSFLLKNFASSTQFEQDKHK